MLDRPVILLALMMLAIATAACGATARGAATTDADAPRSSSFEAWSGGNGTGGFFRGVGPAGGSGVRSGWPQ
jgi:hypothetical protein